MNATEMFLGWSFFLMRPDNAMTKKYSHIYLTGKTEISMDGEQDKPFICGTHENLDLDYARLFFMGQKANAGTTSIFSGGQKFLLQMSNCFSISSNFIQEKMLFRFRVIFPLLLQNKTGTMITIKKLH